MTSVRRIAESRKAFSIATNRSIAFSGELGEIDMSGNATVSGASISEKTALRIAAVWIANTLIADEVSSLVYKLIERDDVARRPVQPETLRPLWDMPNPDQGVADWLATSSLSLTLWGHSITQLGWLNNGGLGRLWPVDPSNVIIERMDDGGIRLNAQGQGTLENHPGMRPEFMSIPLYRLPGQLVPMSPVKYAAELLGLGATYQRMAANMAGRGFNPAAILTFGKTIDDQVAEKFSASLTKLHGGAANRGKVAVIGGQDPKLQPFTMSLADAQFMAQNDNVFSLTMALWRVPPTVVGMVDKPSTWGTGVAEFARGLERFTLRPIVQRLQSGVETYILKWVDDTLQWRGRFDSLLSAAPKDRAEIQRLNLANGMTSIERVLAQNDEPPFDESETRYSPLSQATNEDRDLERLKKRASAAAELIAAGADPASAYAAVGLNVTQADTPPPEQPKELPPPEVKSQPIDLTVNVDLPAVQITNEAQSPARVTKHVSFEDGRTATIVEEEG